MEEELISNEAKKVLSGKLVKLMEKCSYIQKDQTNREQKYKYVSAAAVLEKINPALVELNLASVPRFEIVDKWEKQAKSGMWMVITVRCNLIIIDADTGKSVSIKALGSGADPMDKAVAKAQTMALKYAWMTALNIGTGDDPEADPLTDKNANISAKLQAILKMGEGWRWSTEDTYNYLRTRFNKQISDISEDELEALQQEFSNYLNSKQG